MSVLDVAGLPRKAVGGDGQAAAALSVGDADAPVGKASIGNPLLPPPR